MNKKNCLSRQGSIMIYIMIITSVMISLFSYIAVQALGNLSILNSIKKSLSLEIAGRGLYEEILTAYQDDPMYNRKLKASRMGDYLISRYKDFIANSTNSTSPYIISLTDIDNEYGNSLKSLKYIDVFWNDVHQNTSIPCDLSLSYLKWDKGNTDTLSNNKTLLTTTDFPSLTSVSYSSTNALDIYFSTGVTASGGVLTTGNFIYNGTGVLQSITKVNDTYYTGILSVGISLDSIDCKKGCNLLGLTPNSVQSGNKNLEPDMVQIRRDRRSYVNRHRIKDTGTFFDLVNNNISLSLSSSNICFFGLEGGDDNYKIIPIPDKKAETNIRLYDPINPSVSRQFQYSDAIKLGISLFLSNYPYKIY